MFKTRKKFVIAKSSVRLISFMLVAFATSTLFAQFGESSFQPKEHEVFRALQSSLDTAGKIASRSQQVQSESQARVALLESRTPSSVDRLASDLEKIRELLQEAASSGEIERNGKRVTSNQLKTLASTTMKKLTVAKASNQGATEAQRKLNEFYGDLVKQGFRLAESRNEIMDLMMTYRKQLDDLSHQLETTRLNTRRYLDKGIDIDLNGFLTEVDASTPDQKPNSSTSQIPSSKLKSMADEFQQMAIQLEADGNIDAARSLREKAESLVSFLK